VGRTPWSARVPPDPLLHLPGEADRATGQADQGVGLAQRAPPGGSAPPRPLAQLFLGHCTS
jgi:hypothetical protein